MLKLLQPCVGVFIILKRNRISDIIKMQTCRLQNLINMIPPPKKFKESLHYLFCVHILWLSRKSFKIPVLVTLLIVWTFNKRGLKQIQLGLLKNRFLILTSSDQLQTVDTVYETYA